MFDSWFPYDSAQQIIFSEASGGFDTFLVDYLDYTKVYEANKGCLNGDLGCGAYKRINVYNKFQVSNSYSYDWNGNLIDSNYSIQLYNFSLYANHLSDTGFTNQYLPIQYHAGILLNNKNFQQVQEIINTDTISKADIVYKLYIQKNKGLIGFEYYPSHTLWVIN